MGLKLSKRMETIVAMCDPTDTIVDVGTDHGKVAIAVANAKLANQVIASDINDKPLNACIENAKLYLDNNSFDFKTLVSDGLKGIDKGIRCGIIIAGIGYDLICEILKDIDEYNFEYLILSPHTKQAEFVKFLQEKNLRVVEERTVYEDEKAYFIFKVRR